MRTLVTGGAGFIGSHLVDRLVDMGDSVAVLDDLSTGRTDNLARALDSGQVRLLLGSVLDHRVVDDAVAASDRVFHLAASVGVGTIVSDPLTGIVVNARGTEHVLDSCFRHKKKVLVASTSEIYGKASKFPMEEDDDRVLGSTRIQRWSYSTAKALDEHLALAYLSHGLACVIVRYFNTYGPRLEPRGYGSVIATFLGQAIAGKPLTVYGDGLQSRCFTFIEDTVEGTVRAMDTRDAEGWVFNIGNPDTEITIRDLAEAIRRLCGSDSPLQLVPYIDRFGVGFEDTQRRLPSIERAQSILGWSPRVGLDDGLGRTLRSWPTGNRI